MSLADIGVSKVAGSVNFAQMNWDSFRIPKCHSILCGLDGAVGLATHYGLDGPEIKSRWG